MRSVLLAFVLLASACSGASPTAETASSPAEQGFAVAGAPAVATEAVAVADVAAGSEAARPAPQSGFMLAYSYQLGLMLPGEQLASVMDAHAQACTDAGPQVCQLITMSREGDPAASIGGSLYVRAQPAWLATFMAQAETSAAQAGGSVRARATSAEDLTRQVVDTEARLTALRTLRDRLQGILATRPGRLSDLLEVERELARVQGELDSTVSTLAVMRQRVDMSELTIQYTMEPPALTGRTGEPIRDALSGFLWTSAQNVGVIITLLATVLPWLVLIGVCVWIARRFRVGRTWRLPWRRRSPPPPAVDAAGDGA